MSHQAGGQLEFAEKGQQVVDQLSKANRQQVVDEIRQQPADEISAVQSDEPNVVIRHQAGDELEMLSEFGAIAIKSIFLQSKTKQKCS